MVLNRRIARRTGRIRPLVVAGMCEPEYPYACIVEGIDAGEVGSQRPGIQEALNDGDFPGGMNVLNIIGAQRQRDLIGVLRQKPLDPIQLCIRLGAGRTGTLGRPGPGPTAIANAIAPMCPLCRFGRSVLDVCPGA